MTQYIPAALRRLVTERAGGCCEYCRTPQRYTAIRFAIDHIIAEKHDGLTAEDNLCLSCYHCNSYKGSDISSVDWRYGRKVVPLFDPRLQQWDDHFKLEGAEIMALTPEGYVTAKLLRFNEQSRLDERELLLWAGLYPCFRDERQ